MEAADVIKEQPGLNEIQEGDAAVKMNLHNNEVSLNSFLHFKMTLNGCLVLQRL